MTSHEGNLLGAIFTTFNFEPKYFEMNFLPALLDVDNNEEQDESLQALDLLQKLEERPIAVLMDARANLQCERKFPNYDLFPIFDSTQHSKISVFIFDESIKCFISSANITKSGLHNNREGYVELTFANEDDDWTVLSDIVAFLGSMASGNRIETCKALKLLIQKNNELKPLEPVSSNLKFVPVGPRGYEAVNFAREVKTFWDQNPMDGRKKPKIHSICVQSPFFEATKNNNDNLITRIEKQTLSLLDQKDEPFFDILVPTSRGKRITKYPVEAYKDYENVCVWENPNQKNDKEVRFPHIKTYCITDKENYSMFMVGSSNFSPSALGMKDSPNWEANILYFKEGFSNRDFYLLAPDTDEIKDINSEDETSEFLKDEEYPEPVVMRAIFEKDVLKVELHSILKSEQNVRLGDVVLNSSFIAELLEIPIKELSHSSLVIEESGQENQIFPITIIDGSINDALKMIPSDVIANFIEARYRIGDHLKISDYILEQRRLNNAPVLEHTAFDTKNLLLYEIREFNHITSNIYFKIKADSNYPSRIYYHLNSRFGLRECIQKYCNRADELGCFVYSVFQCMETLTQIMLAFEGCTNKESLAELEKFRNETLVRSSQLKPPATLDGQVEIYLSAVTKIATPVPLEPAV